MLKDEYYKRFKDIYSNDILVSISDVLTVVQPSPKVFEDVDAPMGSLKFGKWNHITQMETEIQSCITEIWNEIKHNIHLVRNPEKYLISIKDELKSLKQAFILNDNKVSKEIQYKKVSAEYYPLQPYWTSSEKAIFKSYGNEPIRPIDLNKEENKKILEYIYKFSEVMYNSFVSFFNEYIIWIEKEYTIYDHKIKASDRTAGSDIPEPKVQTFTWKNNVEECTLKLFELLKGEFIASDTKFGDFTKAFSGEKINKPLKIKWVKMVKGKLSKPLILKLFDSLEEKELIEDLPTAANLHKILCQVFVDQNGNDIKNWAQSDSSTRNRKTSTQQEIELQKLLSDFVDSLA